MYELIKLSEHDYYVDCPAKVGICRINDSEVIAIDSGSDKDAAKKVLRHIEENGWKLRSVFLTHSHADHTGGNRFLQDRTGCKSYAQSVDAAVACNTVLEPAMLYGGFPFNELRNKFLMAADSSVLPLCKEVLPEGFEIIQLPGHSFDMTGFRTADGTVFLADCLIAKETLGKYGISFLWDVDSYLKSLEMVKQLKAECFVPSHAPAAKNIQELVQLNIDSVNQTIQKIIFLLKQPKTFEHLLQCIFTEYGLTMSVQQYVLIGSTLRSYLAYLKNKNLILYYFEDNQMMWKSA